MKRMVGIAAASLMASAIGVSAGSALAAVHPIVLSRADVAGKAFTLPKAKTYHRHGNTATDYMMLMTKDRKFEAGEYTSGPSHFSRTGTKTYGVYEFMYFLKGEVTLTSVDGKVDRIQAGEAVLIPANWQGTWDTKGYTKFYAIYAPKGNAD